MVLLMLFVFSRNQVSSSGYEWGVRVRGRRGVGKISCTIAYSVHVGFSRIFPGNIGRVGEGSLARYKNDIVTRQLINY